MYEELLTVAGGLELEDSVQVLNPIYMETEAPNNFTTYSKISNSGWAPIASNIAFPPELLILQLLDML